MTQLFEDPIDAFEYASACLLRLSVLSLVALGLPYIIWFSQVTGASYVAGGAGALTLFIGIAVRPIAYFVFALSLVAISVRRATMAGVNGGWGVAVAALVLCDWEFGTSFGSHWTGGSLLVLLKGPGPWFLLAALAAAATLACLTVEDRLAAERVTWAYRAWCLAFALMLVSGVAQLFVYASVLLLRSGPAMPGWLQAVAATAGALRPAWCVPLFAAASVVLVTADRVFPRAAPALHRRWQRPDPTARLNRRPAA